MSDTDKPSDNKPPSEDLTPEEEKKFSKFLDKFLAEDDTPAKTPPVATPTTTATNAPTIDVEAAVARALDSRDSKSKDAEWKAGVEAKLAQVSAPKKRKWFEPWTLFSGVV